MCGCRSLQFQGKDFPRGVITRFPLFCERWRSTQGTLQRACLCRLVPLPRHGRRGDCRLFQDTETDRANRSVRDTVAAARAGLGGETEAGRAGDVAPLRRRPSAARSSPQAMWRLWYPASGPQLGACLAMPRRLATPPISEPATEAQHIPWRPALQLPRSPAPR